MQPDSDQVYWESRMDFKSSYVKIGLSGNWEQKGKINNSFVAHIHFVDMGLIFVKLSIVYKPWLPVKNVMSNVIQVL